MLKPVPADRAGAPDPVGFAAALAELTFTITGGGADPDGRSVGTVIGEAAAMLITGAEQGGVIVAAGYRRPDAPDTAVGDLQLLVKVQDDTGEGPCRAAANSGEQVVVEDLRTDARWPLFNARAPWEIRSLLATPMAMSGRAVGVLTMLSTRAWAFDDTSARLATVVAAHTTLALAHLDQIRNLRAMADGRDLIGQAKGILMAQRHLTADQAYQALMRASQDRNLKLRTLCKLIADTGDISTTDPSSARP